MRQRSIEISDEARQDLFALYGWIAEAGSPQAALAYVERIEVFCNGLGIASERGSLRDDIRPGLRVIGFERSASIAFIVESERVVVLRVFYGGRNWTKILS